MGEVVSGVRRPGEVYPAGNSGVEGTDPGSLQLFSRDAFNEVLRLHRERAPLADVYFLNHLCFPLDETRDHFGLRFVLWHPVALFLQYGFQIEIIESMCEGHVILAYLGHDAAAFAEKIVPPMEAARRLHPLWMQSSGPQVLLHVVGEVSESPLLHPNAAEKMGRMRIEFKSAIRRGDYTFLSALRAQLAELSAGSTESDIRKCIELLRASEDADSWPPSSTGLASERSLARDWLTVEEDAAWSHL